MVGGGDGTLNAAALGVIERNLPLGILPLGTANDLARTLGIPPDIDAAARIIAAGQTRTIDLGLVNGQPFFNVASLGLSAELAQQLTQDIKRRWGRLAMPSWRSACSPGRARSRRRSRAGRLRAGQDPADRGRQRALLRRRQRGREGPRRSTTSTSTSTAWSSPAPGSSPSWRAPSGTGEHGAWEEVRAIRAKEFDIHTRRPQAINADGEIVTRTPAHFTIRPNAVTVFTPPMTAEG